MKKLAYLVPLLALTACDPLSGKLDVKQPFHVVVYDGFMHWSNATLPKGSVDAQIEVNSAGNAQITLGHGSSAKLIVMKVNNQNEIPQLEGTLHLSSGESHQPFDLDGVVHSDVHNSAPVRAVESCQYIRTIEVCDYDGCHLEDVVNYGEQDVQYYMQTVLRHLNANLTKVSQPSVVYAGIHGNRSDTYKIYTHKGPCF